LIRGYPVTVNNADFTGFVLDTARELLGPEASTRRAIRSWRARDFSYVLQKVPGAIANLEHATGASAAFPNHSPPNAR